MLLFEFVRMRERETKSRKEIKSKVTGWGQPPPDFSASAGRSLSLPPNELVASVSWLTSRHLERQETFASPELIRRARSTFRRTFASPLPSAARLAFPSLRYTPAENPISLLETIQRYSHPTTTLRLDAEDRRLLRRLWLELVGVDALGGMSPSVLLLLVASVEHRATEGFGIVDVFGEEALPVVACIEERGGEGSAPSTRGKGEARTTHLSNLATSPTVPHFSRNPSRYSFLAISLLSTTPSLSPALAFQIRKFESSEPERTKRESRV